MNWSLILNVLLLVGVVVAIARTLKARRQDTPKNSLSPAQATASFDEIIAVRKIDETQLNKPVLSSKPSSILSTSAYKRPNNPEPTIQFNLSASSFELNKADDNRQYELFSEAELETECDVQIDTEMETRSDAQIDTEIETCSDDLTDDAPLMMFLLAKPNRQLGGYELLQAVLAAGFRFGEGDLFHRHQYPNGQGPVMCSLAAATSTGVFDLQNIGSFMVRGLCLYMHKSGDPTTDAERFDIMMDAAKSLNDGLDTQLLDDQKNLLSASSIQRYHDALSLDAELI